MSIVKSPLRPPKNETVQIRLEEGIRAKLQKYAEFINSSESYVASEALKLLFRKDDEFKTWLQTQLDKTGHSPNGEGSLVETSKTV